MSDPNLEAPKPRRKVKKAKGHAAHHGGAWKVAYADFVTAMMALFLVLWLVSQADTQLKESIANYFRSPGVFETMDGGILSQAKKVSKEPTSLTSKDDEQTLFAVAQQLQKKIQTNPEFSGYKDQVRVEFTDEGLLIQLIDKADRVSFPSGSAELTVDAREILKEIAAGLCELPNKINIGGHTDSHVFPSVKGYTNWELSADRANSARRVLESNCVNPDQIHRIIGYADTLPLIAEDPFAQANRRISITVLKLAKTHSVENGDDADQSNRIVETAPVQTGKTLNNSVKEKVPENPEDGANGAQSEPNSGTDRLPLTEKERLKKQLIESGSVKIGKADQIPDRPRTKQSSKNTDN